MNLGRPIVTSGAFATRLFSNYFKDLFLLLFIVTTVMTVNKDYQNGGKTNNGQRNLRWGRRLKTQETTMTGEWAEHENTRHDIGGR